MDSILIYLIEQIAQELDALQAETVVSSSLSNPDAYEDAKKGNLTRQPQSLPLMPFRQIRQTRT